VDDGKLTDVLESCPQLVSINVRNCRKVTDRFLDELVKCQRLPLKELDIGGDFNITNDGVLAFAQRFQGLSQLTQFSVSGLPVQVGTIEVLVKKLKSIKSLGLGYLDLDEKTWELVLRELGPQLEKLDVSWPSTVPLCKYSPPSAEVVINGLVDYCDNLIDIDITGNKSLAYGHIIDLIERRFVKVC
jgi:hypothetical protein